jgi:hypothetical protein
MTAVLFRPAPAVAVAQRLFNQNIARFQQISALSLFITLCVGSKSVNLGQVVQERHQLPPAIEPIC